MHPARLDQDIVPVFRLPNEILTVIFILYAHHYYCSDTDPFPRGVAPTWVNVSYVCRHWRNVSINCPELWSHVSVTSPRWMEELLARSNQVPLKIYANFSIPSKSLPLPYVLERVADHVERIEELVLYLSPLYLHSDYRFLSEFLSAPAPRLRNLQIMHLKSYSEKPFLLFQGQVPALRRLDLSYVSVRVLWDSFPLRGLTALGLHHFRSNFQLSMMDLLAILDRMPSLEHLELESALICARGFLLSDAFTTTARIYLSRVSYLSITAPISTLIALLSCVDIPLKAQLVLDQTGDTIATPDEYNRFLHLLRQRFDSSLGDTALAAPTIRSLAIRGYLWWLEVACSASEQLPKYPKKRDSNYALVLTLRGAAPLKPDRLISDICSCMPLTDVETFFFDYVAGSSSFWESILGRLPNLKGIEHWNGPPYYDR